MKDNTIDLKKDDLLNNIEDLLIDYKDCILKSDEIVFILQVINKLIIK